MTNDSKKRGLGKGLSALLGEEGADLAELDRLRASKNVPIELLYPGPFQPRRYMSEEGLEELSQSIAEKGILQPILVRRSMDDPNTYEIIAGERRWRAAQIAQLHDVPVVIKDLTDGEALEIALVENLQRQDLSPLEEAEGYRRLQEEFAHNQEDLARSVGKSRSHVANTMRLLALPERVKTMLDEGMLTAGHARALLSVKDPVAIAEKVVKRGLNVRQTERLAKSDAEPAAPVASHPEKDPDTMALERDLSNALGLSVEIKLRRRSGGSLVLHYRSLEQLDDILHRLSQGPHGERAPSPRSPAAAINGEDAEDLEMGIPQHPETAPEEEAEAPQTASDDEDETATEDLVTDWESNAQDDEAEADAGDEESADQVDSNDVPTPKPPETGDGPGEPENNH